MNSRIFSLGRLAVTAMMLIAASAVPASAQSATLDVQGTFDGHGIGVVQFPTLRATANGGGSATQIGRFTYSLHATVNLPANTSTGVFLLVFNNGDVIHGTFTGVGGAAPSSIVEDLVISGGTGRFQGASGSLRLSRVVDQSTLPAFESHTGTMTGTIVTQK